MDKYQIMVELDDEQLNAITEPFQKEIKKLRKENKQLIEKSIPLVDKKLQEKIKELQKEIESWKERDRMSIGHFDSKKELKAYEKFCKKHEHLKEIESVDDLVAGSVYKHPYVKFGGTGIGMCKTVVCPVCGKEKDITDIEVW